MKTQTNAMAKKAHDGKAFTSMEKTAYLQGFDAGVSHVKLATYDGPGKYGRGRIQLIYNEGWEDGVNFQNAVKRRARRLRRLTTR